jgi:hypothetical protein
LLEVNHCREFSSATRRKTASDEEIDPLTTGKAARFGDFGNERTESIAGARLKDGIEGVRGRHWPEKVKAVVRKKLKWRQ